MSQPRYSDNATSGDDSWRNNNNKNQNKINRQRSIQGTGRSNYGRRRSSNAGGGAAAAGGRSNSSNNPLGQAIGNWISNRNRRRLHQQRTSNNNNNSRGVGTTITSSAPVGTEANAILNMTRNALHFAYPPTGFETPIEHSLLYAMIEFPERYPEQVVKNEIEDEEFEIYLFVRKEDDGKKKDDRRRDENKHTSTHDTYYSGGRREQGRREENEDDENDDDEKPVSYAQLSALLSLSAEKNPPSSSSSAAEDQQQSRTTIYNANASASPSSQLSIGQTLCRKLLKTITRYSDAHNLDRQTEISEFLSPVERRCQIRTEKAALQQLLPAYAGYTLSLMTGNPLPLLIGVVALTTSDPMVEETSNVSGFSARAGRSGQMETAGLLDECDSD